jgi:DNA-binding XRE family transcriptional regulator
MITNLQIRAARVYLGYSQEAMAFNVGITQETLSRIESGKQKASKTTMKNIYEFFVEHNIHFEEGGFNQGE